MDDGDSVGHGPAVGEGAKAGVAAPVLDMASAVAVEDGEGAAVAAPVLGVTSAGAVEDGEDAGVAEAGVEADAVGVADPTDVVGAIVEGEVSGVQATSKRSMAIVGSARSRPLHQFFPDFGLNK